MFFFVVSSYLIFCGYPWRSVAWMVRWLMKIVASNCQRLKVNVIKKKKDLASRLGVYFMGVEKRLSTDRLPVWEW